MMYCDDGDDDDHDVDHDHVDDENYGRAMHTNQ